MKILKFRQFNESLINEEELPPLPDLGNMGGAPADGAAPEEGAPTAPKKYVFVFISADKDWDAEYPTGGGIKKYKRYEVTSTDLDKWIEEKKLTAKAEELKAALTGEREMSRNLFFSFKQALRDKSLKFKELAELEVEYDGDNTPYTDNLEVTFLKPEKAEDYKSKEQTGSDAKPVAKAEPLAQPNANDQAQKV